MRIFLGFLQLILSLLVEKLRPARNNGWRVIYRGSFYGKRSTYPLLTIGGTLVNKPEILDACSGYLNVVEAQAGEKLSPSAILKIEVLDDSTLLGCRVELTDLIKKPISGYIELLADPTGLTARSHKYTWGHSISFDTGSSHASAKMIAEKKYPWIRTKSHDDLFFERGLEARISR